MDVLRPTTDELRQWLNSTLRHATQVEYYRHLFGIGLRDPDVPHDISGPGNKYLWEVARHIAVQVRSDSPEFFAQHVLPGIELHRTQYHHRMWNENHPDATLDDMRFGALDALCSLLDHREYQGGAHSFEDIVHVIQENAPYKVKWFWMVYSQMKSAPPPDVSVLSIHHIPNVGIPEDLHARIVQRTEETVAQYRTVHEYRDL